MTRNIKRVLSASIALLLFSAFMQPRCASAAAPPAPAARIAGGTISPGASYAGSGKDKIGGNVLMPPLPSNHRAVGDILTDRIHIYPESKPPGTIPSPVPFRIGAAPSGNQIIQSPVAIVHSSNVSASVKSPGLQSSVPLTYSSSSIVIPGNSNTSQVPGLVPATNSNNLPTFNLSPSYPSSI